MLSIAGILNVSAFSMNKAGIQNHEYYRLITAAFFHVDIIHLLCNMYSLAIIGKEVETVLGKKKFIVVYLMSALISSLLNEVTLKTFYKEKDHIRLQPENDELAPIIVNNCTILGIAIGLYRKL